MFLVPESGPFSVRVEGFVGAAATHPPFDAGSALTVRAAMPGERYVAKPIRKANRILAKRRITFLLRGAGEPWAMEARFRGALREAEYYCLILQRKI
jgi:hypothetical protein